MERIISFMQNGLTVIFTLFLFIMNVNADTSKSTTSNVGAVVRILYSNLRGDAYNNPVSSFDLQHVRPLWKGTLLDGKLEYKLLLGLDKNFKSAQVLDAIGDYKISKAVGLRFGQYKVPFDRQFLTSFTATQFIESGVGSLKPFKRDRGVSVQGRIDKILLGYAVGVFNGTAITTRYNAKNEAGKDAQKHLFAGRITLDPQGDYGYKLALPGKAEKLKTTLGFGLATGQINNDTTDVTAFCVDVAGRVKGFTTLVEYQNLQIKVQEKVSTTGLTAQAGYFLNKQLETLGRYSTKKVKGGASKGEITFGVNYYFDDNNAKLQLNYSRLENISTSNVKTKDNQILLLYQLIF